MTASSRRRWLVIAPLLSLLLGGLVFSPALQFASAQETETDGTARFVHAYAGGGPVDIYVDGELRVEGLEFGMATEYASFTPGDHDVQVVAAGQDPGSALLEDEFSPGEGEAYNVIVGGEGDEMELNVTEVNLDAVEEGMARFRIIHASPDTGDVDVDLILGPGAGMDAAGEDDETIGIDGIGFFSEQDYQEIEAGTYDVNVSLADEDDVTLETPDIVFEQGEVYDLLLIGQAAAESLTILPLVTEVSQPCSELLEVGSAADACVRFVHASPDAGEVDIYLGDTLVVQGLAFGQATSFAPLGAENLQVRVAPAGQATDAAVLDEEVEFAAGQAYAVSVIGLATTDDGEELGLRHHEIDLTPLPAGQMRVRFVHAVPDLDAVDLRIGDDTELFDDVSYDEDAGYEVMDAGIYDLLLVASDDEDEVLVTATDVELMEGMAYDLYAVGLAEDGSARILVLASNATVREGAQATPIAIQAEAEPSEAGPVEIAEPTIVGGADETEIDEAPVTPVTTEETPAADEAETDEEVLTPATTPTP